MLSFSKILLAAGGVIPLVMGAALPIQSSPETPGPDRCTNFEFGVQASAENRKILVQPDFTTFEGAVAFLTQPDEKTIVRGVQKIYGRYCPTNLANVRESEESKTLQLLVHGNTYDDSIWHGFSPDCSYEAAALDRGYNTLTIDRLGNGRSSHPDPTTDVQAPYQVELLHALIEQICAGTGPLPSTPQRVAWVGHSYGSILGNNLAARYPGDVDAYMLTGLAMPKPGDFALPGQFRMGPDARRGLRPGPLPARPVPAGGYLVTARRAGRRDTFYGADADFDAAVYDAEYAAMGTLAAGEALTQNLYPAPGFAGPVFVFTGQQDAMFCGNGTRAPPDAPDCGSGATSQLAAVHQLFPGAAFDYYAQPRAGHVQMTHYSARDGFEKTLRFLGSTLRFLGSWLQNPDAAAM